MSQSIWTPCGGSSNERRLDVDAWRVVESQYVNATRKLVDSDDEQRVLEELIDGAKPPAPAGREFAGLHYLLATPFRHPPLRNGSRFGARTERGIFYGSREQRTAFAEVAYYRLVFLEGSDAQLGLLSIELTAFQVGVVTARGIDLTRAPFDAHGAILGSKTSYAATQRLGREMREAGVVAFVFASARDAERGANVGVFAPSFRQKKPRALEGWICNATRERVELRTKSPLRDDRFKFPRAQFEVGGKLPSPAT